jgi:hypothetical protein
MSIAIACYFSELTVLIENHDQKSSSSKVWDQSLEPQRFFSYYMSLLSLSNAA